ncbi:MAG: secretin N-terminal domain-containing protein [Opitutaceae bacterium]
MKTNLLAPTLCLGFAALTAGAPAQIPAPATTTAAATDSSRAPGELRFNFRGAPLETVLNYMSEAAGFIIVMDTPVRGNVDMYSAQPVTKAEAIQLLQIALSKNGYTAVVQGRTIVIASKDDAKKKNLPIRTGNNPEDIPMTAEMFIQIIPLRHLDATTAARDLGTLLPGSSAITANTDSNSLLVTDTNINLKQVVTLVNALDSSSDTVSTMKVFKLVNADPYEMAQLLTSLYGTPAAGAGGRGGTTGTTGRGGFPGFGGGLPPGLAAAFGGGGAAPGGSTSGRGSRTGGGSGGTTSARTVPVVAVADPRTYSVIVTAAKEVMPDITEMVAQLDSSSARKQKVFVYTMENANVKQVETVLKNLFQSSTGRTTTNNQPDALTTRATQNAQQNTTQNLQLGTNSATTGARTN